MHRYLRVCVAIGLASAYGEASATNGYFSHGYGIKAKGRGGAATAMTDDAFGGANNPAAMVWAGDRFDVGLDYFRPIRRAARGGSTGFGAGSLDFSVDSDSKGFFIPEFGLNRMIRPDTSLGITVYGNGGLNTDYAGGQVNCGQGPNTANALCGSGRLGVDLIQLIVAPTLAYKIDGVHSIGIAPLLGYQRFRAEGLQAFDNAPGFPQFTGSPGSVTNNGYSSSTGAGVRVGYLGRLSSFVSIGASYASKMRMSKLDRYKGLFAGSGQFDIPENYSVGVAVHPTGALTIALDYQRINYSGVAPVGNQSSNQAPLGAANGPGFGWRNVDVVKLGIEYAYSENLTLRAGLNHGSNPVTPANITFNILAPGVVTNHFTVGLTQQVGSGAWSLAYMHAPKQSVSGASLFNGLGAGPAGGQETVSMKQDSLGIAYGMKF